MDPNRLTLKTQEALHDAQTKAQRAPDIPKLTPSISCSPCWSSRMA
jgi:hypothetical protein